MSMPVGTTLERLRLRGTRAALDASHSVRVALERADWPESGSGDHFVLRRIEVKGTVRDIAGRTVEAARLLMDKAVDADSPGASSALAVRFRSPAHREACWIRDALDGAAPRLWFWKVRLRSGERPLESLPALLSDQDVLHLPQIMARLRAMGVWERFWKRLPPITALGLAQRVASVCRWERRVRALQVAANAAMAGAVPSPESDKRPSLPSLSLPRAYEGMLRGLPPDDGRVLLAALLAMWESAPGEDTEARPFLLGGLLRSLTGTVSETPKSLSPLFSASPSSSESPSPLSSESSSSSQLHSPSGPPLSVLPDADLSSTIPLVLAPEAAAAPSIAIPQEPGRSAQRDGWSTGDRDAGDTYQERYQGGELSRDYGKSREAGAINAINREAGGIHSSEWEGLTAVGGMFHLLHFLSLPAVRTLIAGPETTSTSATSPWLHLIALGNALGVPPDHGLMAFLAWESGHGRGFDPEGPIPEATPAMLELGKARYGELWSPAIFRVPARLCATRSHIDLHFPLAAVRLDVRLAGLDVDPGWIPWLGKVVHFHFGSGREPEAGWRSA
jgi:hypothetical protein